MPIRGKTAGNRNQGSNWCDKAKRRTIHHRDKWRCVWCCAKVLAATDPDRVRLKRAIATVDHVEPRARGGGNEIANLVTACMACNRLKADSGYLAFAVATAARTGEAVGRILARVAHAVCGP